MSVTLSVVALLGITGRIVTGTTECNYGIALKCPGESCSDIYQKNPKPHGVSGQYIVKISDLYAIVPYSTKFWQGKTLVNLVNQTPFANISPSQIPDSLK